MPFSIRQRNWIYRSASVRDTSYLDIKPFEKTNKNKRIHDDFPSSTLLNLFSSQIYRVCSNYGIVVLSSIKNDVTLSI